MTYTEYQPLAFRTCKQMSSIQLDFLHMAIGLGSEYYELDDAILAEDNVNVGEEIADKFWYIAGYCTLKGWDLTIIAITTIKSNKSLPKLISIFQDLVKKDIVYNKIDKNLNRQQQIVLSQIISNLIITANGYGLNIGTILSNNIAKLKVRYPDKYSDDKAINRDLFSERKELEK